LINRISLYRTLHVAGVMLGPEVGGPGVVGVEVVAGALGVHPTERTLYESDLAGAPGAGALQ
jgi:hypothetical protein